MNETAINIHAKFPSAHGVCYRCVVITNHLADGVDQYLVICSHINRNIRQPVPKFEFSIVDTLLPKQRVASSILVSRSIRSNLEFFAYL